VASNVTHLDKFGLVPAFGGGHDCHRYLIENLPKIGPCYDDLSASSKSIDSQSVAESFGSESSNVEEIETSDTESLCRSAECNDSSSVMELSSSCCLSDKSTRSSDPDTPCKHERVTHDNQLSNDSCCANMHGALPSHTSNDTARNESQLVQHQPLVFFIMGLFVGLSLGFFTCKCVAHTLQISFSFYCHWLQFDIHRVTVTLFLVLLRYPKPTPKPRFFAKPRFFPP